MSPIGKFRSPDPRIVRTKHLEDLENEMETSKIKSWGIKLAASLLAMAIFAGLLEGGARLFLMYFAEEETFYSFASLKQFEKKGIEPKYVRHRFLGYTTAPNYKRGDDRHNSLGYRGDEFPLQKPAGEFRIVCMGGSTTYSSRIRDYHLAYPDLLEKELRNRGFPNVKVINAGVPGWASLENMINLELNLLDLSPDLIIYYEGVNDVRPRLVWPPEFYKSDNSAMRGIPNEESSSASIWESSTLIRMILVKRGAIMPQTAIERVWDLSSENYYGEDFTRQKMKGSYPKGIFKKVSAAQVLEANPPIYFRRNIENIVDMAKARGIRPLLATFVYTTEFEEDKFISSDEVKSSLAATNQILREVAQNKDASLFDFATAFPSSKDYYADSVHNNEKGSQLKAELFAKFIAENNLIPKPN